MREKVGGGSKLTYDNLKKNTIGETLFLIGIILHILNIILVVTGVWGDLSKALLITFSVATIPYIVGFIYIKKAPSIFLGYIFILISLFLTHYIASLFFIIGSIFTIYVARKNKHILQNVKDGEI